MSDDEARNAAARTLMESKQNQRRFDGFRSTPSLWEGSWQGLTSFATRTVHPDLNPEIESTPRMRFGKLMEQFVLFELAEDPGINILGSNIQIFNGKETLGELDCLIEQAGARIHLEIGFKFYVYDPTISGELNRWIGPNRRDSLVLKLDKLKQKQLPLLYKPQTVQRLHDMGLDAQEFRQQVNFRTQLFVPWNAMESTYPMVNPNCISGFYLFEEEVQHFSDHHFHIPTKLDWVVEPHADVTWINYDSFTSEIKAHLASRRSPLCWMKSNEGKMQKFFVLIPR